ncbi:MAG: preprotein translocase subunit SecA [Parcubacteria bacterium C7867-005]|nr:MAG: preprotein translocase subunit SecA [Parcubacteria bacterium C7867-005]
MAFLSNLFKSEEEKMLSSWQILVDKTNTLENTLKNLSPEDLRLKTVEFKERFIKGESLDSLLPEAFAVVRESAMRTLGQRHFDVQLLGGIALHKGGIAEMRTGEGKTLVATLSAYLNALSGQGVHVVTVNDYLSRRDAVWMGQVYSYLGLSIGVLNHAASYIYDPEHKNRDNERDEIGSFHVVHEFLRPTSKQEAYKADIIYGTNNEFGFDYLRDNLVYRKSDLAQGPFSYAIVDEIDSILIDEARTPLIISSNTGTAGDLYSKFASIASKLTLEEDFTVDEKLHAISLTDKGITKAESLLGIDNIYTTGGVKYVHHLETAVRAQALYNNNKEYVVKDGEIIIVDQFTGRMQPGRRWSEGLHQAIEAKEGVNIKEESKTFASITFQNYFRMYKKLSGMTGTAITSKEEFYKVYGLDTFVIPTNRKVSRLDQNDLIFQTQNGKMKAVSNKVKELNTKGQPVLIGTVSIEHNELLSAHLTSEGINHEILNAKNHEREGEIIAQAGKRGAVTIATNMAGRGVDIKLGGNPGSKDASDEVKELGGLFVLGTERHDARRIDNQLRGRSGRQGDPGETQFFVSLEDNLMRIFATDSIKSMMGRFNIPEDEPIQNKLITRSLEKAQEKIEGFNFDARKHVLDFDDVLNHQRSVIYGQRRKILSGDKGDIDDYLHSVADQIEQDLSKKLLNKISSLEDPVVLDALRRVILQTIDMFWVDHLEMMEYLRGSVNLRAYGQRDPLVEYKKEGLRFFKEMEFSVSKHVAEFLIALEPESLKKVEASTIELEAMSVSDSNRFATSSKDIGRNDPCPCGAINPETGKIYKFKQCGLISAPHHRLG